MSEAFAVDRLFARHGPAYRWYATVTVMLGTLSVVLASTIINVAVPAIMARFAVAQDQAQWLVTAFLAAMTVGMLLNAWAIARLGSRRAFTLAMSVFIAASLVGGLSRHFPVLVAARAVQGLTAGMIQPHALIVIFQVFPVARRGQAMGIYGMGVILGPAVSPALGGVLVDAISWRATFFVVLPACVLALGMAWRFLPAHGGTARSRLDWPGVVLLAAGMVATLWMLAALQRRGPGDALVLAGMVGGPLLLVAFVLRQSRAVEPLFDLALFRAPGFGAGFALSIVMGAGLFATTYLTPLYFQQAAHMSPTAAGFMLLPAGIAMALVFPLAGHLSDGRASIAVIATGLGLFIGATVLLVASSGTTAAVWLIAWAALARVGIGAMMPPVTTASLRLLEGAAMDRGSGIINFGRQFGGALGVNLCAVLAQYVNDAQLHAGTAVSRAAAHEAGFDAAFWALAGLFALAFWPLAHMRRSRRRDAG
ncbi:DHA2 family efflux MFS transporter permease subunit [Salinisphaera orenii]|uniref:Multidrug transporter n=1 Tax=Salinisphaera orenii YIM 95161 TaxID=1051139 RepID=A0A423PYV8_9GAMM|nr:DHA2 family efflux MFS transporter permease subunit [Salinisphaera halophila]ROO30802.1 multidrug transporter [Salinisphaera halophila YIM 95161]